MKSSIFCAALLGTCIIQAAPRAFAQTHESLGLRTVVIDPGHGGKDSGAISKDKKTQEKKIVLEISKLLKKKIEELNPGVSVFLTRDKDEVFVPLIDRARFATGKNADFFISVHINSNTKTTPNGYSIHLLGPSTDKNKDTYAMNMDVVQRENSVILLEEDYSTTYQGFDPNDPESDIFLHLMANAYREQSQRGGDHKGLSHALIRYFYFRFLTVIVFHSYLFPVIFVLFYHNFSYSKELFEIVPFFY